jgi:hypothetical protein
MLSVYVILAALDPGVYSASNRNQYLREIKMFFGSRARLVPGADKHRHQ